MIMSDVRRKIPTLKLSKEEDSVVAYKSKTQIGCKVNVHKSLTRRLATLKLKYNSQPKKSSNAIFASKILKKKKSDSTLSRSMQRPSQIIIKKEILGPVMQRRSLDILLVQKPKSLTQLIIQTPRRMGNFQGILPIGLILPQATHNDGRIISLRETVFLIKAYIDSKIAGLKMYNAIILKDYRKRRNDVQILRERIIELQLERSNDKKQLYSLSTLLRGEHKINRQLDVEVALVNNDIQDLKRSCATLTTSVMRHKSEKEVLQHILEVTTRQVENVFGLLNQNRSKLFKAMAKERVSQIKLANEQRRMQEVQMYNDELMNLKEFIKAELTETELNIEAFQKTIELLNQKQTIIEEKEAILQKYMLTNSQLVKEIQRLKADINVFQRYLGVTLVHRLKSTWNASANFQKITIETLHLIGYYMLPAIPAPRIRTFPKFTFGKFMGIIKR